MCVNKQNAMVWLLEAWDNAHKTYGLQLQQFYVLSNTNLIVL